MALYSRRSVSVVSELSPLFSALGQRGAVQKAAAQSKEAPLIRKRYSSEGNVLFRWQLCPIEKRGPHQGATKKGKGTKIMVLADEKSRPVSVIIASASVHEVRLVEEVIRQRASKAEAHYR